MGGGALDPNYLSARLVLESKLKSADAKIEAAERALEMVAPGLLATQDGEIYGSILELGTRATAGSDTIRLHIQNALLKASVKIGPMNSGRCAGAALILKDLASDKTFIQYLIESERLG